MKTLILARHAQALSNVAGIVESTPPGGGLTEEGEREAEALGRKLVGTQIDLALCSRFLRTSQTLEFALDGMDIPRQVERLFDEIGFGSFDGGPLATYRSWAWANPPGAPCPGGGESRGGAAARFAAALELVVGFPQETVLVVTHALVIRYVLDAADGAFPAAQVVTVPHASPFVLDRDAVLLAAETLHTWAAAPRFADTPFGG